MRLRQMAKVGNKLRQFNPCFHTEQDRINIIDQLSGVVYINIKNGDEYIKLGEAIDCNNELDGHISVLYTNFDGELFTRELNEFNRKFKLKNNSEYKTEIESEWIGGVNEKENT